MTNVANGFPRSNYPPPRPESIALFWTKVDKSGGPDACWLWRGQVRADGYGSFAYRTAGQRTKLTAHRYAMLVDGANIAGLFVCHWCDRPLCVNPAHMFVGTPKDNLDDMAAKGRKATGERTRNWEESKLLRNVVAEIRDALGDKARIDALAERYQMAPHSIYKIARRDCFAWVK